jgi:hypothetical protein
MLIIHDDCEAIATSFHQNSHNISLLQTRLYNGLGGQAAPPTANEEEETQIRPVNSKENGPSMAGMKIIM